MIQPTTATDQAQPQSLADRVAAQFGLADDEPEQVATESPETEEETVEAEPEAEYSEVEYDGQTYQVPKALEKAILQEKDYTQKTQTLAEQRRQVEYTQKALEAAKLEREFHESVANDLSQLRLMDNYLQQMKSADVSQLPIDELIRHKMSVDGLKEQRDALDAQIKGKRDEYTQKAKEQLKSLKAQARELLAKQIPNFSDDALTGLASYAQSVGYTEQDVEMIQLDPRATALLHKARLYDELQASKAASVQTAKTAPPVIKPGSRNPMPQQVRDKLALRKAIKNETDSVKRARLIEAEIANRFS